MREGNAPLIRREDYAPPPFWIRKVDLTFDLDPAKTLVINRMQVERNGEVAAGPLKLHGEDITLTRCLVNGESVSFRHEDGCLVIDNLPPEGFSLEIRNTCAPEKNTRLSGLYTSSGGFFTQCEAEGFRRITFFLDRPDVMAEYTVLMKDSKAAYPVLLSNGNLVEHGELDNGRHFAKWHDPFAKPSYLFALVAADLVAREQHIRSRAGKDHLLQVYVRRGDLDKTEHAMSSLVASVVWDEARFGLALDLERFMIVAVGDFNMGAMENKGLNIFNAKFVLANPATATDADYAAIESVVGHEYFHNWSGNRVTCRDWFQLSLKEGFTVFREHSFCEAMHSPALKRIEDVATLRRVQFPEDAGPLAHPVRPAAYQAIDNFYTATVYEKGAELIRMLAGRLGAEGFRQGTDLYFSRFDGQAVTIDDLLAALGEANGVDLSPYLAWYAQAGTPEVRARDDYDAAAKCYTLTLAQRTPPTPGQPHKQPVPIPVNLALFADDGARVPLRLTGDTTAPAGECVLELTGAEQRFVFEDVSAKPTPSLCRGLSAPVRVHFDYAPAQLARLLKHETGGFDRWNAAQQLAACAFDEAFAPGHTQAATGAWLDALASVFAARAATDPALLADLLTPPSELELGTRHSPLDPDAVHAAREVLENALVQRLGDALAPAYRELHAGESGALDQDAAARRRLKGRVLALLSRHDPSGGAELAFAQYRDARSMTDRLAALAVLVRSDAPQATEGLRLYRQRFDGDALTLDKWFLLQATVPAHAALERVRALEADPAFTLANPNRVHALLGAFARGNPVAFHRPDGAGHRWFADKLAEIDARNPQLSARLAKAFEDWTRLEPKRRTSAEASLRELLARGQHSLDLREILTRMLVAGGT